MAYTPIYCTIANVKDKSIATAITRAGWTDDDVANIAIQDAEVYVEAKLVRLGYTRAQLKTATLVTQLVEDYSKYVILRDIFTQDSPSHAPAETYEKWLKSVTDNLAEIEANTMRLTDSNGAIINPVGGDSRYKVAITTQDTKRAVSMKDSSKWRIDELTYASDNVIGKN